MSLPTLPYPQIWIDAATHKYLVLLLSTDTVCIWRYLGSVIMEHESPSAFVSHCKRAPTTQAHFPGDDDLWRGVPLHSIEI